MAITIKPNLGSLEQNQNAQRSTLARSASFDRLASGVRAPQAKDDAAGLDISESMSTLVRSFAMAGQNAEDAVSMVQTAESALGQVHSIMGRMRELATRSLSDDSSAADRRHFNVEYEALKGEIGNIQQSTRFNGKELLSQDASTIQVQLPEGDAEPLVLAFGGSGLADVTSTANVISGSGTENALRALAAIDSAMSAVSTEREKYGTSMSRLDATISTIETMRLNLAAANTRIRDVDVAAQTATLAKEQVLSQAGVSMLAQANQLPQLALNLLQ